MIEYRVKRVERFIVTRHEESDSGQTGSTRQIGNEYDGFEVAYEVGHALARADQERLGLPPGDMGVIFPSPALEDARRTDMLDGMPAAMSGASVCLVIAASEDGDEYGIFSSPEAGTEWADARPEGCVIAYPMVVDAPEFGNTPESSAN